MTGEEIAGRDSEEGISLCNTWRTGGNDLHIPQHDSWGYGAQRVTAEFVLFVVWAIATCTKFCSEPAVGPLNPCVGTAAAVQLRGPYGMMD